jgi:hypothetical protein
VHKKASKINMSLCLLPMFHLTHEFVVEQRADVDGPEEVQVVENVQRHFEHSLAVADSAAQALDILESSYASLFYSSEVKFIAHGHIGHPVVGAVVQINWRRDALQVVVGRTGALVHLRIHSGAVVVFAKPVCN